MTTVRELLENKDFQRMSYDDQQYTKDLFFQEKLSKRPDVATLDPETKGEVYRQLMELPPAIEGLGGISLSDEDRALLESGKVNELPNAELKSALWLREKAKAGDENAQKSITGWITSRRVANETLLGQAIMGATDAVEELFGKNADPLIARNKSNLSKISNYLLQAQTEDQAATTETVSGLATIGAGFAETVALNMIFVGTSAANAGLMTRGLYAGLAKAGSAATQGVGRTFLKTVAPLGVEAIGSGTIDVLRSLPQMLQDGDLKGDNKLFSQAISTFGEGVAFDLVASAVTEFTLRTGLPFLKSFRNLDIGDEKTIAEAIKKADWLDNSNENTKKIFNFAFGNEQLPKELLDQMEENSRKFLVKDMTRFQTALRNLKGDLSDPNTFKAFATASGFDAEVAEGAVKLLQDDEVVRIFGTIPEAASFLFDKARKLTPEAFADEVTARAARTLTREARLVRAVETKIDPKTLPPKQLAGMLSPNSFGVIEPNNVKAAARGQLRKLGVDSSALNVEIVPAQKFYSGAKPIVSKNTIQIPDTVRSAADQKYFLEHFDEVVRQTAEELGTKVPKNFAHLAKAGLDLDTLNPWALEAAASKLDAKVLRNRLGEIEIEIPGNAPQTFQSLADANQALSAYAYASGKVSKEAFTEYIASKGLKLVEEAQPETGTTLAVLRNLRNGTVVDRGNDFYELMARRPELVPKLPEELAPDITFIGLDDSVLLKQNFISGPESEMRQMLNSFTSTTKIPGFEKGIPLYTDASGAEIVAKGKNRVGLEVPELGFRQDFRNLAEAKRFLDKDLNSFDVLTEIAYSKGIRIDLLPSGRIAAKELNGKMTYVKSLDELKGVLKNSPDPELQPELVKFFGKTETDEMAFKVQERLRNDVSTEKIVGKVKEARPIYKFYNKAYSHFAPMRDTLERIGRIAGMPDIPKKAREYDSLHREFVRLGRSGSAVVDGLFKINGKTVDRATDRALAKLLELPEQKWAETAKAIGFDLKSEHQRMLYGARALLNRYGEYFGVDAYRMLQDYAPKIRDYYKAMKDNPKEYARFSAMSKQKMLQEVFAGRPDALKTVDFFAKHTSLNAFLGEADNRSARDMLNFYIKEGLNEKLMGRYIEDTRQWLKKVQANENISQGDMQLVTTYFKAISGEARSDALLADLSLQASTGLSNMLKKINNKFVPTEGLRSTIDEMLDDMVTTDLTAKANSMITYATLGFRPIRGLTNMMQQMNTAAIFGDYFDDAVKMLHRDKSDVYVKQLFNRGILDERVFASTADATRGSRGIFEMSLRSQQNTEYLIRARTAKAAELAFDDNLVRYARGEINFEKFVDYSNMDMMSPDSLLQVKQLLDQGNTSSARDLFQRDAIRWTMFDYGRENYPMMFKGVLGRMFGKFGVYPIGQIGFYNRIASSGPWTKRLIRGARFVAYATATHEAFRLAGIDYSGFLAYDPFTFSGGPLFSLAQDVLNSRDTGPQGAIARKNLVNSYRLFVPFSTQAGKMLDAIESGSKGELHKALIESLSSKYTYDNIINGKTF